MQMMYLVFLSVSISFCLKIVHPDRVQAFGDAKLNLSSINLCHLWQIEHMWNWDCVYIWCFHFSLGRCLMIMKTDQQKDTVQSVAQGLVCNQNIASRLDEVVSLDMFEKPQLEFVLVERWLNFNFHTINVFLLKGKWLLNPLCT